MTKDESTIYYAATKGLFRLDLATKKSERVEIDGVKIGNLNSIAIDDRSQVLYITDAGPIRFEFGGKECLLSH